MALKSLFKIHKEFGKLLVKQVNFIINNYPKRLDAEDDNIVITAPVDEVDKFIQIQIGFSNIVFSAHGTVEIQGTGVRIRYFVDESESEALITNTFILDWIPDEGIIEFRDYQFKQMVIRDGIETWTKILLDVETEYLRAKLEGEQHG